VLFSASLVAELLPDRINDPQAVLHSALELRRLTSSALAEMRTLLLELRPIGITRTPLADLLTQLTEAVTSRSELQFQLFIDNLPLLPAEIQVTFYRIAQEALNNIVKHSQAQNVMVTLSATPPMDLDSLREWEGEITMTVRDDGLGFIPGTPKTGHMGLGIMGERASAIGAELKIESRPDHGSKVILVWKKTLKRQNV
jgi:signal transduction histidine kinase